MPASQKRPRLHDDVTSRPESYGETEATATHCRCIYESLSAFRPESYGETEATATRRRCINESLPSSRSESYGETKLLLTQIGVVHKNPNLSFTLRIS